MSETHHSILATIFRAPEMVATFVLEVWILSYVLYHVVGYAVNLTFASMGTTTDCSTRMQTFIQTLT